MKLVPLLGCLFVTVNAGTYGGQKTSLEDIENDYTSNDKSSIYIQTAKSSDAPVSSPTKFGFVPHRTASSYVATKPKYQYTQANYQVKKSPNKPQSGNYDQQYVAEYTKTKPQVSYQQHYSSGSTQQFGIPEKYTSGADYSQYSADGEKSFSQQQGQEYAYVQPEVNQQYSIQYQQPLQQYENVQYVTDNSISQQPQYYYVQQYQSPSTTVESVLDPKDVQYVMFVPSYAGNSIPLDEKYQQQYTTSPESQVPSVTTSVAKYTTVVPSKTSNTKQYANQKDFQSPKVHYRQQEEIIIKREPKSLLDSYVPSTVQLQYLKQQGKSSYSKY